MTLVSLQGFERTHMVLFPKYMCIVHIWSTCCVAMATIVLYKYLNMEFHEFFW